MIRTFEERFIQAFGSRFMIAFEDIASDKYHASQALGNHLDVEQVLLHHGINQRNLSRSVDPVLMV